MKFDVGIIGLGNIGMGYDLNRENLYLTHIKSFDEHPSFAVKFVVDTDQAKLKSSKKYYPNVSQFYSNHQDIHQLPDLLILASHPSVNLEVMEYFKEYSTTILVEKPILKNLDVEYTNSKLMVNYFRRTFPFYRSLKYQIMDRTFGDFHRLIVRYSGDFVNTASHFLDLIFFLTGAQEFDQINWVKKGGEISDLSLQVGCTEFILLNHSQRNFYGLDLDFYFENKRILVDNYESKVTYFSLQKDQNFSEYKDFRKESSESLPIHQYGLYLANYIAEQMTQQFDSNDLQIQINTSVNNAINIIKHEVSN